QPSAPDRDALRGERGYGGVGVVGDPPYAGPGSGPAGGGGGLRGGGAVGGRRRPAGGGPAGVGLAPDRQPAGRLLCQPGPADARGGDAPPPAGAVAAPGRPVAGPLPWPGGRLSPRPGGGGG